MIKLYTIGCPACNVLEQKLKAKNIEFEKITDETVFREKGIEWFPQLELDNGILLGIKDANNWLKAMEDVNG